MTPSPSPRTTPLTHTRAGSARGARRVFGWGALVAWLLIGASLEGRPASARPVCGDHASLVTNLGKFHAERPKALGLSADGNVVEVLVSATGSWSIIVSYPNRVTCLVATGEKWEHLPVVASGRAS